MKKQTNASKEKGAVSDEHALRQGAGNRVKGSGKTSGGQGSRQMPKYSEGLTTAPSKEGAGTKEAKQPVQLGSVLSGWDAYVASGEFGLDEIEADIKSMEQGYFVFRRWDKDG